MSDTKILSTAEPAPARAASRADHVYYALRDDIFDMRLMPGDRVTEGGIAERCAVSRTPAREALQRLQSDGLMQGYVRGGWEVVPIDIKRFDDLYEMRQLIETFAVRKLCSAGASSPGFDSMLDALDAVWRVARKKRIGDGRALVGLDESFHHALVAAANNDELTSTMQRVTDRIRVVRRLDLVYGNSIGATYDEHVAILDAVRSRDIDASVELIARHIQGSQAEVRALTVHRLQIARTDMVPDSVPYAPARLRRTI